MMEKCSICDKELSHEDSILRSCKEHRPYASYFIPEVAKMTIGLISEYPEHLKKCAICQNGLSETELKSFSPGTFHPVCTHHRAAETMYSLEIAKNWFEFAKTQPQPFEYNDENRKKWTEYRKLTN